MYNTRIEILFLPYINSRLFPFTDNNASTHINLFGKLSWIIDIDGLEIKHCLGPLLKKKNTSNIYYG